MSAIRITHIPPGFAPESIRSQWIGVELPLATEDEIAENPPSGFGIGSDNAGGYLVLRSKAIGALRRARRHAAADYWSDLPLGRFLQFNKEVYEVVA